MNAKLFAAGLAATACLIAQPPHGPHGFGPGPGGPGFRGPGGPPPAGTVAGAPFSGVEVHTRQQVLANGTTIQQQDSTKIARDGQGRVRRESTRQTPDGKTVTRVSITDPVAGVAYDLDPADKVAYSHPAHFPNRPPQQQPQQQQAARARAPRAAAPNDVNMKRETLAAQSINGVIATGSRVTHTIPAGTIGNSAPIETVHETWMADDLKMPVKTRMTDPRTGTSTTELTNILRGEPDATLFTVPSDYTVKKAGPGGPRGGGPPQQHKQ